MAGRGAIRSLLIIHPMRDVTKVTTLPGRRSGRLVVGTPSLVLPTLGMSNVTLCSREGPGKMKISDAD